MDILDAVVKQTLPGDSSRQVVRRELFKRAFVSISEKSANSRQDRRKLSRYIAKDLWKRGERLDR